MRTVQPRGPYSLLGDCFGGFVAFEMARQLREKQEVVSNLVFIETSRPSTLRDRLSLRLRDLPWMAARLALALPFSAPKWLKRLLRKRSPFGTFVTLERLDPDDCRRNKVVREVFPGLFDDVNLDSLDERTAWDLVLAKVAARSGYPATLETVSSTVFRHREYVDFRNFWNMKMYQPKTIFPGRLVMFSQEGTRSHEHWAKFSRDPILYHGIAFEPTIGIPDLHNVFLEPVNLQKYADALVASL